MESVQPLMSNETMEDCYRSSNKDYPTFLNKCLRHREARLVTQHLDSSFSCDKGCSRGVCQFKEDDRYEGDSANPCYKQGVCGGDGVCSLPGPRSGHAATSFAFNGGYSVLLLFGGEIESVSGERKLSGDVFTGYMQGSSLTWARMNVDCPEDWSCPIARRDASIAIVDSRGGSNGKLIIFGGFAGSLIGDYLTGKGYAISSLDDLWYLDLDQINSGGAGLVCLQFGKCLNPLRWVRMDVPGGRPPSRFGAGMSILDSNGEGVLYLTGGINKKEALDTSAKSTIELNDLYLFQLRDPFYRRCSATGKGLVSAIAGQETPFLVACTDLLGAPAIGAQFDVAVLPGASCTGCPSAYPPVLSVGVGLYQCIYTPTVAGEYGIFIKVGRGGDKFQEAVGGDPNAPASTDPQVIKDQLESNRTFFEVLVLAATTNQMGSTARGQGLTLTTSGVGSEFTIAAVDSYMNRRPGGEDISVVMDNMKQLDLPRAGKVTDNSDGTYTVTFAITVSSTYSISITFNSVLAAGSPHTLHVKAQNSDETLTYAYGNFRTIMTGRTHMMYVQTKDRYGNYISTDPEELPTGSDEIQFEYCTTIGATCEGKEGCVCNDGEPNPNVAVEVKKNFVYSLLQHTATLPKHSQNTLQHSQHLR